MPLYSLGEMTSIFTKGSSMLCLTLTSGSAAGLDTYTAHTVSSRPLCVTCTHKGEGGLALCEVVSLVPILVIMLHTV